MMNSVRESTESLDACAQFLRANPEIRNMRADIIYDRLPWQKPVVKDTEHGAVVENCGSDDWPDLSAPGPHRLPGFWRTLVNLRLSLIHNVRGQIEMFYRTHGPIGYPERVHASRYREVPANKGALRSISLRWRKRDLLWRTTRLSSFERGEPLSWVMPAVEWFYLLTKMVQLAKDRDISRLRSVLQPVLGPSELWDGSRIWLTKCPNTVRHSLWFYPWHSSTNAKGETIYRGPKNDNEVLLATWEIVRCAVQHEMQQIPLAPVEGSRDWPIRWGFKARGTLEVAFLQWFFEEVASHGWKKCAASDCENPVIPPRRKWCSETCEEREKKRSQAKKAK